MGHARPHQNLDAWKCYFPDSIWALRTIKIKTILVVALAKCQRATIQNKYYQYANMDLSLSGQTSIFNGVFFVFKSLWELRDKRNFKKNSFLTGKPLSHVRILIIDRVQTQSHVCARHFFFVVKNFFLTRLPARIPVCFMVTQCS